MAVDVSQAKHDSFSNAVASWPAVVLSLPWLRRNGQLSRDYCMSDAMASEFGEVSLQFESFDKAQQAVTQIPAGLIFLLPMTSGYLAHYILYRRPHTRFIQLFQCSAIFVKIAWNKPGVGHRRSIDCSVEMPSRLHPCSWAATKIGLIEQSKVSMHDGNHGKFFKSTNHYARPPSFAVYVEPLRWSRSRSCRPQK
jgi:hypothetical protein